MKNADKFKGIFGIYASELWAKTEKEFLEWLNEYVPDTNVGDMISRQAAIDAIDKYYEEKRYIKRTRTILSAICLDMKSVIQALPSEQPNVPDTNVGDMISRQAAIDALWKALYEYEDETEKQFLESEELDVADWFLHRIFVQNMSDIDRQTILKLPSVQPERKKGKWTEKQVIHADEAKEVVEEWQSCRCSECGRYHTQTYMYYFSEPNYCSFCGADMRKETEDE